MTTQAEGSYFGPKHLEQVITCHFHSTENRPRKAKATLQVCLLWMLNLSHKTSSAPILTLNIGLSPLLLK